MMKQQAKNKKININLLHAIIAVSIFLITVLIGVLIFIAVCKNGNTWSDIPDVTADTDMSIIETEDTNEHGSEYIADLYEYEEYINPILDMRDEFLVLVNSENKLSSKYQPDNPTPLPGKLLRQDTTVYLSLYAEKALEAMFKEMEAAGVETTDPKTKIPLTVTSAYISYSDQKQVFDSEVERLMRADPTLTKTIAEELADITHSRPGSNEHQSGLAVDIHNCSTDSISFKNSEAYIWLSENSWRFGFILRYPEGKSEITGVQFRPWHFRYVGRYHAAKIYKENLCLEEYLQIITQ